MNNQQQINVDAKTHEHLKHITEVTKVPMARIISMFVQELWSLSVEYDHATLRIDSRVTEDTVYAVLHGYGKKLTFGTCHTEQDLADMNHRKIFEDLKKKSAGIKP